jgi:serine/threonine protein kinase
MPFPTIQEYNEVLNMPPGTRPFRAGEPTLDAVRNGTVEKGKDKHFLHHDAGQYAAVYRFIKPDGKALALRCLLQVPPQDVQHRCVEQQAYLQQHPLPYFVEAGYYENALEVSNEWYPVFTMDWVQGRTLHEYVQRFCKTGQSHPLSQVAAQWETMLVELRKAGIAHGDLHPLNALVRDNSKITLVDYDTLFVPALKSLPAPLSGCEGYVHPSYLSGTPRPFNEAMDTFGGAVVLLSLRALADDPTLFERFSKDNLLFTGDDLSLPNQSKLFDLLERHRSPQIAGLASALREECRQPAETGQLTLNTLTASAPKRSRHGLVPDLVPEKRVYQKRGSSGL